MADDLEAVLHETGFHSRMLPDLLREAFGSDLSNSQETMSSVTPEMLASISGRFDAGDGHGDRRLPAVGRPSKPRPSDSGWRRASGSLGAAAATAALAALLLARGGGARSQARELSQAPARGARASLSRAAMTATPPAPAAAEAAPRSGAQRAGRSRLDGYGEGEPATVGASPADRTGIIRRAGSRGQADRVVRGLVDRSVRRGGARRQAVTTAGRGRAIGWRRCWRVALVTTAGGGRASEAEREARAHFQAGEARFKAGAFDEALAAYQAGYDVLPLPGFLINVAQCQRRLGDLKTARATYQKFVLVAPDSPLVPQVRSMVAEIDGLLADSKEQPESRRGGAGGRGAAGGRRFTAGRDAAA